MAKKIRCDGAWLVAWARRSGPVLALAFLLQAGALADDSEPVSETMDAMERRLELNRHERLARRKATPGIRLTEFTTDGCSGGLSAGWEMLGKTLRGFRESHGDRPPWEACCIAHDRVYHAAGPGDATPIESFEARREADLELRACVVRTGTERAPELGAEYGLSIEGVGALYEAIADLMYRTVRVGGIPCSGLPWRWGYGWPKCD